MPLLPLYELLQSLVARSALVPLQSVAIPETVCHYKQNVIQPVHISSPVLLLWARAQPVPHQLVGHSRSQLLLCSMSNPNSISGGPGWIWTWENNYADILIGTLRCSVHRWLYCVLLVFRVVVIVGVVVCCVVIVYHTTPHHAFTVCIRTENGIIA